MSSGISPFIPGIREKQAPEKEGTAVCLSSGGLVVTFLRNRKFRNLPACGGAAGAEGAEDAEAGEDSGEAEAPAEE